MSAQVVTGVLGAAVAIVAIVAATIAVSLGAIQGEAFVAIVTTFGGIAAGAGVHAAGKESGSGG